MLNKSGFGLWAIHHAYLLKIVDMLKIEGCFPKQKSLQTLLVVSTNQHQNISENLNAISALRVRFSSLVR
eukprot:UN01861